ncbi:MAG: hypothetical protein LBE79_12415, partial [Tannerella sp.]|nr:hypothetical protein [Tannerella sp.]
EFDPFDFNADSAVGKSANKIGDVVTDFIPVVGNAKSAGKVLSNIYLGWAKSRMADRLLIDIEIPVNSAIRYAKVDVVQLLTDDIYALHPEDELVPLLKICGIEVQIKTGAWNESRY